MSNIREEIDRALSRNGYYVEFEDDVESPDGHGDIYIEASYNKLRASYRGTDGSFDIHNWKISPSGKGMDLFSILNIMSEFLSEKVLDQLHRHNEVLENKGRYRKDLDIKGERLVPLRRA